MIRVLLILLLVTVLGLVVLSFLRAREAGIARVESQNGKRTDDVEALGKQALAQARSDVQKFGWHMVAVPGQGEAPGFVFTIGLWKTYHHPELILFIKGDPQTVVGRLSEVAKRVAAGEVFSAGKTYDGLFGKFGGSLRKVERDWYPEFLGTALGYYETDDFPVLQLFWPDRAGRFPWQSGFESEFFPDQPLLFEINPILANVGGEARKRRVGEDSPEALRGAWGELFVELPSDQRDLALEDWRWLVGLDAKLLRVTLFGDLLLQTPDGHVHWLDTGSTDYQEIAGNESEGLETMADHLPEFFHASTLLAFRDLGYLPKAGQVYSWQLPPMLGGEETAENFDVVPATVHISNLGRTARAVRKVPPGTKISDVAASAGAEVGNPARRYKVVINAEEQYSMWPEGEKIPDGWKSAGKTGTQQECLDYIRRVWVDMRPLSLRKAMAAQEKEKGKPHDQP